MLGRKFKCSLGKILLSLLLFTTAAAPVPARTAAPVGFQRTEISFEQIFESFFELVFSPRAADRPNAPAGQNNGEDTQSFDGKGNDLLGGG